MASKWCKNYRGMLNKTRCDAGVEFAKLPAHGTADFYELCPCFNSKNAKLCAYSDYLTPEEADAEDAEMNKRLLTLGNARNAIIKHLGGPWKRGDASQSGLIDCPVCKAKDALKFTRSGYNGHIHACCVTSGCVNWME